MTENSFDAHLDKVKQLVELLSIAQSNLFGDIGKVYVYCFGESESLEPLLTELLSDETKFSEIGPILSQLRDFVLTELRNASQLNLNESITKEAENALGSFFIAQAIMKTFGVSALWSPDDSAPNDELSRLSDEFASKLAILQDSNDLKKKATKRHAVLPKTTDPKAVAASKASVAAARRSFEEKVEKLLSDMRRKCFSFDLMSEIAGKTFTVQPGALSFSTFRNAIDCLVTAYVEVDIRVRENYLNVMKRFFFMVADFNEAMRCVYQLDHFRRTAKGVPELAGFYKNFDTDIAKICGSLTEINTFAASPNFNHHVRSLAFLLTISPRQTIRQLLFFMIQSKPLWPSVLLMLERIPAFFELRVPVMQSSSKCQDLLIIIFFRRLLSNEDAGVISMDREADRENLLALLLAFTRTTFKNPGKKTAVLTKRPLVNATILLRELVMHYLSISLQNLSTKSIRVEFILDLLNRMFRVDEERQWVIDWENSDDDQEEGQDALKVQPYILLSLLIEKYTESDENSEIRTLIPSLIKSLANKLEADGVLLSSNSELILQKLDIFDWNLRYCVYVWLGKCVDTTDFKIAIPDVLYESLATKCRVNYAPITSTLDCSETENFIRCVFDLAMSSTNEALDFIKANEFALLPTRVYSPMIADALLRSIRMKTSMDTLMKLLPIVDGLFSLLDVSVQRKFGDYYTERTFEGMRKLSPILVLFEALFIYIKENLKDGSECLDADEIGHDAKILLEAFTKATISYVNDEFFKLKTATIVFKTEEFGSHSESQLIAALYQIGILFTDVSYLAENIQPIPSTLKVLKGELSQLARHLHNKVYPPYANDISRYRQPSQSSRPFTSSGGLTGESESPPKLTPETVSAVVETVEGKPSISLEKENWRKKTPRNPADGEKRGSRSPDRPKKRMARKNPNRGGGHPEGAGPSGGVNQGVTGPHPLHQNQPTSRGGHRNRRGSARKEKPATGAFLA